MKVSADFCDYAYSYKWLCSRKGSAFHYARREKQHLIEPLVVSWGWAEERSFGFGHDYLDNLQWLGANDMAAYLAAPAALRFQADHNWPVVRRQCHELVNQALCRICDLTGLPSPYSRPAGFYRQMAIAPLPPTDDLAALRSRLYKKHRVEIPCLQWGDGLFISISVQGYNDQTDIDRLVLALESTLTS